MEDSILWQRIAFLMMFDPLKVFSKESIPLEIFNDSIVFGMKLLLGEKKKYGKK